MKEDFLHYLWKYKKFDVSNLKTSSGEKLNIINSGQYTQLAGPDFFNSQIEIDNQKWAGNVEIHIKSSDWYAHHHEKNSAYDSVILHVVWQNDTPIFRQDNTEIPVLELQGYVSIEVLNNYQSLMNPKSWIFCEKQIQNTNSFILENWKERLFVERLERKSKTVYQLLENTNQDWEAVLFLMLAMNFGLNTNGEIFLKIAQAIPFSLIRKERFEVENIEALLFGMAGLLEDDKEDNYFKDLKFRFFYLLHKYQIEQKPMQTLQFFKHRPDNFPTIRLSQLAHLYHLHHNLFTQLIVMKSNDEIYNLLIVSVSNYWQTHYQFDKESPKKEKKLTKSFIDLLLINTIVPIQFAYAASQGKEISEQVMNLLINTKPEKNSTIDKFSSFQLQSQNAFDTQSLLQLKKEYCNASKCLSCAVGIELLKV